MERDIQSHEYYYLDQMREECVIIGRWSGDIDYEPSIRYELTSNGREILKKYRKDQLISKTNKCSEDTCKGEYGSEVYRKTDCVTCGRDIIRG